MNTLRRLALRGITSALVIFLPLASPASVLADTTQPDSTSTQSSSDLSAPVATPANGTTRPTGSASGTYHYNDETGLWENDYYTFDPVTKVTTPKVPLEYTYNASTGMWDTLVWQYNAAQGEYQRTTVSVVSPPEGAITHGDPVSAVPTTQNTAQSSTNDTNVPDGSSTQTTETPTTSAITAQSANGATDTTRTSQTNTANLAFNTAGTITNYGTANATSGNVLLQSNTTAGNASSGNTTDVGNYLNLLQSQAALSGANVATFTKNIQGDVSGDLIIDPAVLMQPASQTNPNLTNLNITTVNNGSIVNNVNLGATSGNTTAAQNTSVGNVNSGTASAVADVINMINSVVAANQSFMGVINIEGNYTGNILVPTDSLNALLGSSASDPSPALPVVSDVRATSTQNISNNVNLAAASGNVTASDNTKIGSVSSGNGLTNLTLLNLTGRNVVAANSLLVFVNVLGSWVGLIMDAPVGTTAAALGGGVISNSTLPSLTSNIKSTDTNSITNNITADARSGDVSATQNTLVGNVSSGDASASANIANLINSNFSLSNWFGVLFINVLGTWHGNFGTVKPPVVPPITTGASSASGSSVSQPIRVFQFVGREPSSAAGGHSSTRSSSASNLTLSPLSAANQSPNMRSADMVKTISKVISATTTAAASTPSLNQYSSESAANKTWSVVALAFGVSGLTYVGIERVRTNLRRRYPIDK